MLKNSIMPWEDAHLRRQFAVPTSVLQLIECANYIFTTRAFPRFDFQKNTCTLYEKQRLTCTKIRQTIGTTGFAYCQPT